MLAQDRFRTRAHECVGVCTTVGIENKTRKTHWEERKRIRFQGRSKAQFKSKPREKTGIVDMRISKPAEVHSFGLSYERLDTRTMKVSKGTKDIEEDDTKSFERHVHSKIGIDSRFSLPAFDPRSEQGLGLSQGWTMDSAVVICDTYIKSDIPPLLISIFSYSPSPLPVPILVTADRTKPNRNPVLSPPLPGPFLRPFNIIEVSIFFGGRELELCRRTPIFRAKFVANRDRQTQQGKDVRSSVMKEAFNAVVIFDGPLFKIRDLRPLPLPLPTSHNLLVNVNTKGAILNWEPGISRSSAPFSITRP
ncbi:hypothetical protein F5878DRAFT_644900 [Lentinula raphanica]|uniref:Uncharacterized protein n=1 Tax=Lentinula raphanica TaxID=153919 RepID=A0AA38P1V6_9AGAR|nr:hypothetical protein F5878DRAFT_644900 [Lentinula raphanica]